MVEHTAVDVNFTDLRAENSALHNAVWCSKNRGHTPLHIACMEQHGVNDVAFLIHECGFDINVQDNEVTRRYIGLVTVDEIKLSNFYCQICVT
jgi:hypothetical protein